MHRYFLPLKIKIRRWQLRIFNKKPIVTGKCRLCGKCCRQLCLDLKGKWITRPEDFRILVRHNPQYERFVIHGKATGGIILFKCTMLDDNNLCLDHENRPNICREYPNPLLYEMGGKLERGCGYSLQLGTPFATILAKKMKKSVSQKSRTASNE
ncbi:MAG: YkgJ family cysteine cluster protein [Candidatus Moranbacteria bacterium]|nr:YkgJ family cysteine cluster protein [Candidatus Moranbacteria bacterium]